MCCAVTLILLRSTDFPPSGKVLGSYVSLAYLQIAWHNFQRLPVTVTVIYKYICNITTYLEGSIICCLGKKANRPIVPAPKSIPFPNHLPCDGFLFINSVNLYIFLPPSNRTLMGQRDGKHRINPPPPVHDFFKIGVGGLRPNRRLLTPPPIFAQILIGRELALPLTLLERCLGCINCLHWTWDCTLLTCCVRRKNLSKNG